MVKSLSRVKIRLLLCISARGRQCILHRQSRVHKTYCFHRSQPISVHNCLHHISYTLINIIYRPASVCLFLGATVSVETEFSPVMSRQYLNVNFIPTAVFTRKTEGLCGFMDDDDSNDLIGPNGEQYDDATQFAESCKFAFVL